MLQQWLQENTQWQRTSKLKFYDRRSFYLRPRRGQLNNPTHHSSIVLSFIVTFKVHILFTSILPINKWLACLVLVFKNYFLLLKIKKHKKLVWWRGCVFCVLKNHFFENNKKKMFSLFFHYSKSRLFFVFSLLSFYVFLAVFLCFHKYELHLNTTPSPINHFFFLK